MLRTLKSGTVKNLNIEVVVNEKPLTVSVDDNFASAHVPIDDVSSISISINRTTGKISISHNNIDSVSASNTLANAVVSKMKAIITEIETL